MSRQTEGGRYANVPLQAALLSATRFAGEVQMTSAERRAIEGGIVDGPDVGLCPASVDLARAA